MKIVQVHNRYRYYCGEDGVFDATVNLLRRNDINVILLTRNSQDIESSLLGKLYAFASGLYCFSAANDMNRIIQHEHPDVVHLHNIYPLLSPSILFACRRAGTPVVMSCHNYRLICPTGYQLRDSSVCEMCSGGREYWCVLKNCRRTMFESVAYSLRNAIARIFKCYHDNIILFIAISYFIKRRLIENGFPEERILVVPNMVPLPPMRSDSSRGEYIAYVGRISPEKGIDTLIEAAALSPQLPIRLAGDGPLMSPIVNNAPKNTVFEGFLNRTQLAAFYEKARFVVVPSIWCEPFGLVAAEAMSYGLPVIASRIGGLPEIVEDGVTGFLFDLGNSEELARKMKLLWENPELCQKMGQAGWEKVIREYSEDIYYERLMNVYRKAIKIDKGLRRRKAEP